MKYQLDGVEDNFKNMEGALKQNDRELIKYQRELEERKNQLKIDEMKQALEETKKIAGAYKASTKEYVREDENGELVCVTDEDVDPDELEMQSDYDVMELITDNQMLL